MDSAPLSSEHSLGIFAKFPQAGLVKSRLAAATSADWAARVADAFIRDTVERLAAINVRRVLVYAPAEQSGYFADIAGDRFAVQPQGEEGDLGTRLERFIAGEFHCGARRVVVVGTDSPTLPPSFIEHAFRELEQANVVLGPATDGGYYLLGCTDGLPPIFNDIPWGSDHVLKATIERLSEPAWRLALLPIWYDIDVIQDWRFLCTHVAAMRRAGIDPEVTCIERLMFSPHQEEQNCC